MFAYSVLTLLVNMELRFHVKDSASQPRNDRGKRETYLTLGYQTVIMSVITFTFTNI